MVYCGVVLSGPTIVYSSSCSASVELTFLGGGHEISFATPALIKTQCGSTETHRLSSM